MVVHLDASTKYVHKSLPLNVFGKVALRERALRVSARTKKRVTKRVLSALDTTRFVVGLAERPSCVHARV